MFRRTPRVSRAQGLFNGTRSKSSRSRGLIGSSFARRLRVEALEDRRMLAVTVDFTGAYAMQNWSQSGIADGDTSQNPASGATDEAVFGYTVTLPNGSGVSQRTADFTLNNSLVTGSVTFDYVYTGNHRYFQAAAEFSTVYGGSVLSVVVNSPTSGGFNFSGSASLIAQAGQSFGFRIGGNNNDSNSHIDGTLTITNFRAYDSIVVDSLDDEFDSDISLGNLSLREAVYIANIIPGADKITIAPNLSGQTISLDMGELEITESLTIDASEVAAPVTIDAQQNSRVLNFSATSGDLTLAGLTMQNGRSPLPGGGIYFRSNGTLTLNECTLSGNSTTGDNTPGGGIFTYEGDVTLTDSTLSGNSTAGHDSPGGGIYISTGVVTLNQSTLSGNSTAGSNSYGGGIFAESANITLTNSTLSGNSTAGEGATGGGIRMHTGLLTLTQSTLSGNSTTGDNSSGGGVYAYFGVVTLTSSTLSGNSTAGSTSPGGGIYLNTGVVALYHSTITGNGTAGAESDGGGIVVGNEYNSYPMTIRNSIIAGNTVGTGNTGPDLVADSAIALVVDYSLIGTGITPTTGGNNISTDAPGLAPLANNGGPTQTHALLPGSPALDAGDPAVDFDENEFDQRRAPFVRVFGSRLDIGAFEAELLVVNNTGGGSDGDIYNGITTLREAIGAANFLPGANVITFALNMSGQTILLGGTQLDITEAVNIDATALAENVIVDAQQQSRVINFAATTGDLTLAGLTMRNGKTTGAGAVGGGIRFDSSGTLTLNQSTLSGNSTAAASADGGAIYSEYGAVTLNQSTLSGNSTAGDSADGGGIFSYYGAVTLNQSTLSGNSTAAFQADGGGIYTFTGDVTLNDSTLSGNSSTDGQGGGIYTDGGAVTLNQSTLAGNSTINSFRNGGAIYNANGDVTIHQSTVSGNSTTGEGASGGAIYATNGSVTLNYSTLSGNSTAGNNAHGGGIYSRASFNAVTLNQSTVTGNSATGAGADGGGIYLQSSFSDMTIHNSIFAGNTVAVGSGGPDFAAGPGNLLTVNFSVLGTEVSASPSSNNIFTDAPLLGPLANNGGPTQTHALLPGSPAIEAGDNLAGAVVGGTNLEFSPSLPISIGGFTAADEYSIELVFSFDALGGYQKIIDFHDLADDAGLYAFGANLDFFGTGIPVASDLLSANTPVHLVVTRDAATDVVVVYAEGVEIMTFIDDADIAVFSGPLEIMRFFQDDTTTGGAEAASGFVDRIRIYDRDLSAGEVAGLVFDQRGAGFDRVVDANGDSLARIDIGAYEAQVNPSADFDNDGDVDGRDFLAWQRGFGTPNAVRADGNSDDDADVDGSDLAAWQVSYGVTPVPLSALTTAIETTEPDSATFDAATLNVSEEPEMGSRLRGNDGSGSSLGGSLAVSRAREDASELETAFEESYVEEVDRALEQFDATDSLLGKPAVAPFGEMVARRGRRTVR
jgi:hypothetical protein